MTSPARRYIQHDWAEPDLFLMADEALIESAEGARFRLCPLEKDPEPLLRPTEVWEGGDGKNPRPVQQDPIDGSIVYDAEQERFLLWYRTHNRLTMACSDPALGDNHTIRSFRPEGSQICLATSKDGLNWEKPVAGQVLFNQSYKNNMVQIATPPILADHLSGVLPNHLSDEANALVGTVYSSFADPIYPRGITQIFSADGIDWQSHFPPTLPLDGDAHCLMWDSRHKCYLCTTRSAQHARIIARLQLQGMSHLRSKRHIALAKSRDLIHWTPMLDILDADDKDPENAQLYYMYILPYGHAYLGFVQLFYMSPDMTYGPLEMQLAISTDLDNWRRVGDRVPILPRGPQGAWDQSHVSLCTNPPHPEGDRMRFWYGGKDTEHWQAGNGALGTATLRRDGFACWEAGEQAGTVTTKPLKMDWATWPFLNVDASQGEVRVEILSEDNQPIRGCAVEDCLPIRGDHLRAMVAYKQGRGNFIRHTGSVKLRFHLRNAKLYAFKSPHLSLL